MITSFKQNAVILLVGIFILLFISMNAYSRVVLNWLDEPFGYPGENSLSTGSIGSHIVDGAGYFLKGQSEFLLFLNRVETSPGVEDVNASEMQTILNRAVENMEKAKETYAFLKQLAYSTPYNPLVMEKLLAFDYETFRNERGVNNDVFAGVKQYLAKGDVRGIFAGMLANTGAILQSLNIVKGQLDAGQFPELKNLWRLNQSFAETMLLGQYAAEIMYALNE